MARPLPGVHHAHPALPTLPAVDPRDLRIVSDNRADTATIARLCPATDLTRRAAAGLMVDLRPRVIGELAAVDRGGRVVPMEDEIRELHAARGR